MELIESNCRLQRPTHLRSIAGLVKFFGYTIPKHRRTQSFFIEHAGELEWIYHDCRRRYLELAKKAHPDNGGGHESSVAINTAWDRLTHLFSLHCSSIKSPTFIPREARETPRKPRPVAVKRPRAPYVLTPARQDVLAKMREKCIATKAWLNARRVVTPRMVEASKANVRKMLAARGITLKSERPPSPIVEKVKKEPPPYAFTPARQAALEKARFVVTPARATAARSNLVKARAARKTASKSDRQPLTPTHFP